MYFEWKKEQLLNNDYGWSILTSGQAILCEEVPMIAFMLSIFATSKKVIDEVKKETEEEEEEETNLNRLID
jgi:hypothetical protein